MSQRPDQLAALALVEGIPAGASIAFGLLDAAGTLLSASPSLATMTPGAALPPEIAAALRSALAGVLRTGRSLEGLRVEGRTPGAERQAWDVDLYRLDAGGDPMAGLIVVDVGVATRAAAELRESERQLADAQRIARMGWWTWSAQTGRLRFSAELADVFGRERRGAHSLEPDEWLDLIVGSDSPAAGEELRAAAVEGRPFRFRHRVRRSDGALRLIESEGEATLDGDGQLAEVYGIAQDITAVERSVARQRAVAELGRLGLGGIDVEELLDHARALVAEALWVEEVAVLDDGAAAKELRAGVAVAIDTPSRHFGELRVQPDVVRPFDADEIAFLDSVAHVLGEAIGRRETAAAIAELAASRGRLVGQALDAEDRARRSISERLHDGPLQDLLAAAAELYATGSEEALGADARLRAIARDLREVMAALHPTVLQYGGLRAALAAIAEHHARAGGFEVEVCVDEEAAGRHDELLLSIARHLLAGVARHARAARVTLALGLTAEGLRLEVTHDGRGLPPQTPDGEPDQTRLDLATSAERAAAVGGRLVAGPGGPDVADTAVVVELPLARTAEVS